MAGSSCGVIPIAIASENSKASITGLDMATLMTKIETVRMPAIQTSSARELVQPDLERRVGRRRAEPDRDPAERGRRPGGDHHPAGRSLVHDRAHERAGGRSTGSDSSPGAASADFAAGIDSPVSTASSHSSCVASSSRMSAGTTFPMPSVTMSPGTSSRTSTRRSVPSRRTSVKWRMLSCKATAARSERYSLTKPSPTLSARIAAMITASAGSPVSPEIRAAAEQQEQQRVSQLPLEHSERGHAVGQQHVRAERPQAIGRVRRAQPLGTRTQPLEHCLGRQPARRGGVERRLRRRWGVGGFHGEGIRSTAEPRISPASSIRSASPPSARSNTVVSGRIGISTARSRNARASARVKFATDRRLRSRHSRSYENSGTRSRWIAFTATVPPGPVARSAETTTEPAGANVTAASRGAGGRSSYPPTHDGPQRCRQLPFLVQVAEHRHLAAPVAGDLNRQVSR